MYSVDGVAGVASDATIEDVRRQFLADDSDPEAPSRSWDQLFSD